MVADVAVFPRAPSASERAAVIARGRARSFNYPKELVGTSGVDAREDGAQRARLRAHGWFWAIDRTRARVGRGQGCYERAKRALEAWEHFDLDWARADAERGTEVGGGVCVTTRAGPVWMANPLEIVRLREGARGGGGGKRFAFAHGTLVGHVLAGEERFAVELTSDGEVYYEAYTFSRPAHALSVLGYPVVRLLQKKFHRDSTRAMKRILGESE